MVNIEGIIKLMTCTKAEYKVSTFILEDGEPCYIKESNALVFGDGVTQLKDLPPIGKTAYIYRFSHGGVSPVAERTYHIGDISDLQPTTIMVDSHSLLCQGKGAITNVSCVVAIGGSVGSGESSTFVIENLTKGTSSVISDSVVHSLSHSCYNFQLATPLQVDFLDQIQIRWQTPAWVTLPSTVRQVFNVKLEIDL